MKIIVCDKTEQESIERMRTAGLEVDVRDEITPEELANVIGDYEGMVVRSRTKVRANLIDKAVKMKIIVRGGVGLDTIDADYARSKGIKVVNTPAASSISVAELTIGYLFALARKTPQATCSLREQKWEKKKFEGTEIYGKTLGVVGMGRIGFEVAMRAGALGMQVLAYDPFIDAAETGQMVSLDHLLQHSDYITFHLPMTAESHHMISTEQFEIMKPGVQLINCARGGIIDEEALYEALKSGRVAGAAMDVFAEEPLQDFKLFELDNVIGSPHIGATTKEAQSRIGAEVADKLIDFYRKQA